MTPQSASVHARGLAGTVGGIGLVVSTTGKPSEAKVEYRTALAIQQKLAEENPAVALLRSELAQSHDNLAVVLRQKGKPREAEAEYRAALVIRQKLADENPGIPGLQRVLADALLNLGWWLAQAGKPAEESDTRPFRLRIRRTKTQSPDRNAGMISAEADAHDRYAAARFGLIDRRIDRHAVESWIGWDGAGASHASLRHRLSCTAISSDRARCCRAHTTATFTQWIGGNESKRQLHSSPPSRPIQSWPVVVPK
jgi:tetratricopeptide (TPR) repeat protein